MSNALKKLTTCMEKMFKESPEARKAMREWLDELEREQQSTSAPPIVHLPTLTIGGDTNSTDSDTESRGGKFFGKTRARFDIDPQDYGWKLDSIVDDNHGVYTREFEFGMVALRYYFSSGTIQLVYPRSEHPDYIQTKKTETVQKNKGKVVGKVKKTVEDFRHLTENHFKNILTDAPYHFGRSGQEYFIELELEQQRNSTGPGKLYTTSTGKIIRAPFDADPDEYGWKFLRIQGCFESIAIYKKEFSFGEVELVYFFGMDDFRYKVVRLEYPLWKHPRYNDVIEQQVAEKGETVEKAKSRICIEDVQNLNEQTFQQLLENCENFFGVGQLLGYYSARLLPQEEEKEEEQQQQQQQPSKVKSPTAARKSGKVESQKKVQSPKGKYYDGMRAIFDTDPETYKWELFKLQAGASFAFKFADYRRKFRFGLVELNYHFLDGQVALTYPKFKHPKHAREEQDAVQNNEGVRGRKIAQVVEVFERGELSQDQFNSMLINTPNWFGKGNRYFEKRGHS